ncbi:MAG TPA: hypothetical protein VNO70_07605 [Blastocatellia bacterium]|nr:hypothetical protein [Blastocatellia bacterium]
MTSRTIFSVIGFIILLLAPATTFGKETVSKQDKSTAALPKPAADLVSATNQYKSGLAELLPLYEQALKTATETYEKRKELYAQGIISRRDLEASEQAVKEAQAQLDETRKKMTESDQLIAEIRAEQEAAKLKPASRSGRVGSYTATAAVMRYGGSGGWSLANIAKVQSFFTTKFGRSLPVSAYGQTATHDRMRFDHRNSVDVAVHPDSAEGQALIAFLRANGIPYIAFRSAVPGAATGAHIHIGYPSHRTG